MGVNIRDQLLLDEGLRLKPYKDSLGVMTIGVGHNLEEGISNRIAMLMLDEDIEKARADCMKYPWFQELNDTRKNVILNMMFNLGIYNFSKFHNMITAIAIHDYEVAADEMKDSKWYTQVGARAQRLEQEMRNGN